MFPLVDAALLLLAPPKCAACDRRLAVDAVLCAACVSTLEPAPALPAGTTASFAYGGALSEAIHRFKYGARPELSRPLRRLVVEGLPDLAIADVDVVAPIPLHVARLRKRGFDQATMLAYAVAEALARPLLVDLLERVVDTPQLAHLDRDARSTAVCAAFRARPAAGLRVLLVDDVRTTGATLAAAGSVLVDAGATVTAHVLAATPRE